MERDIPKPTNGFLDALLPEPFQHAHPLKVELEKQELEKPDEPTAKPSASSSEDAQM